MATGTSGEQASPDGADEGDEPVRLPVALTDEAQAELAERAAPGTTGSGSAGRPNRHVTSGAYRRTADFRVSTTDPDATPMPHGDGRTRLGYQDHYVVDGGKARIILTALVTPAEVQENQPALDLLWRARFRWKLRPRQVTGDTKYGTVENIVAIERAAHPRLRPAVGGRPAGRDVRGAGLPLRRGERDVYRCPGGADPALPLAVRDHAAAHLRSTGRGLRRVRAPGPVHHVAAGTAHRPQPATRTYLDRVRGYHATEPYAKAMRKRQVWVEPLFAEAKDWHGLRRFRLRGLEKVNGEALLIAAGQNLKRLLQLARAGAAARSRAERLESSSRLSRRASPVLLR